MATRSYARIVSGVVAEVVTLPATAAIGAYYDPATAEWIECTATPGVAQGWTYAGGVFAAPRPPSLAQQAEALLAAGCAISSTATPALNATYACDAATQNDVIAEVLSIVVNKLFTNGTATLAWPDATGAAHSFTVAQFTTLATALGAFVGTLKAIIATGTGTLPVQPSLIP